MLSFELFVEVVYFRQLCFVFEKVYTQSQAVN